MLCIQFMNVYFHVVMFVPGGVSGVFEVDELVTLLEKENARDIVVINIPPEARFGDQMVIVSAVSHRHLRSMSSRIKWVVSKVYIVWATTN